KVERESYKILGKFDGEEIVNASFKLSASCHRVNVLDGHTEAVFVELESSASVENVKKAFKEFSSEPQKLKLPTAPTPPIIVREEQDRPQPRLDRYAGHPERARGMAVVVGRIRKDSAFENGVKYVLLSHNTIRGAAGNSVLIAELLKAKGLI
ncbi:MAG: aspartate-semialdehyde dehydrogenase, partial [Candidatus Methanomethylicota archaeon]